MNDYLIATASTCDIDAGWLNEHNVPFISYSFIIDDVPYEDDCKEDRLKQGCIHHDLQTEYVGSKQSFRGAGWS